jgi:transcriptional regulator with XRE-family HTH domain
MHANQPGDFGQKIKKIRLLKGYKQEYLAYKIGISQTSYSKLETGETNLSIDRASAIANILGMSLSELVEWTG